MTLLEIWRNSPTRRKELADLLQEPALVDAIAIIKEGLYTLQGPPTGAGQYTLIDYYAMFGATQHGYLKCLRALLGLAEIRVEHMPDRKPWDQPDKERLAQQMAREQGLTEEPTPNA
jgi:hypothetical protein